MGVKASVFAVRLGIIAALSAWCMFAHGGTFVVADSQKPDHPVVQALEQLGKLVSSRSQGATTIQIKASGELGSETAVLEQLRKGTLAMGRIGMGVLGDKVHTAQLFSLPYLFHSRDHMWNILRGELGSRLESEISESGVVVLAFYDSGSRNFYANKPIRNRDDFKGLKLRVQPSPIYKDLVEQLGATAVVLGYDKVLPSLKNGEVDGAENNIVSYISAEHYKYAKYLSLDAHSMVPDVLLMSKKVWNSLKPAEQDLLKGAAAESSEFMAKLWQDKERESLAFAKKNGVTIYTRPQLAMTGIEALATKLYSRHVQEIKDLDVVLQIVSSK